MKKRLKDYMPILFMLLCAAIFGTLLLTGAIDLDTVPQLVDHRPLLAVIVILALYAAKGFSGVILYNALVIVVSLIFPIWQALLVNGIGTAIALSISYWIGSSTKTQSLESLLAKYPKIQKYFKATQKYGFVACFAIHMIGLSMEVLGVIFGMLRIGFWRYLTSSWLAIIPGMICFTIAGNNLSIRSPVFWIVLVVDLALIAFGILYTRRKFVTDNTQE